MEPLRPIRRAELKDARLTAMVEVACDLMQEGSPTPNGMTLHRPQKADTAGGLDTIKSLAAMGAPYAMLLYERCYRFGAGSGAFALLDPHDGNRAARVPAVHGQSGAMRAIARACRATGSPAQAFNRAAHDLRRDD